MLFVSCFLSLSLKKKYHLAANQWTFSSLFSTINEKFYHETFFYWVEQSTNFIVQDGFDWYFHFFTQNLFFHLSVDIHRVQIIQFSFPFPTPYRNIENFMGVYASTVAPPLDISTPNAFLPFISLTVVLWSSRKAWLFITIFAFILLFFFSLF